MYLKRMQENFALINNEFIRYKIKRVDSLVNPIVIVGSWECMIEDLEQITENIVDRTSMLIECRGMGLSTCRSSFTLDDCSKDIIDLITQVFNKTQVHIVGFSLGGNIVLGAVSIEKNIFSSVAVFATKLKSYPVIEFPDRDFKYYIPFEKNMRYLFLPKYLAEDWLSDEKNIDRALDYCKKFKSNHSLMAKLEYEHELIHTVYFRNVPPPKYDVNIPLLSVFGGSDISVPHCYAKQFKTEFPRSFVNVMKGEGHLMFVSNSEACSSAINNFIRLVDDDPQTSNMDEFSDNEKIVKPIFSL
jgi:pimeloyl-ACP methyl ester carboxylesterase